jgi:hypothetical protein
VLPQRLPVLPDRRRLFPGDRVFHDIPIGQFRERRRCLALCTLFARVLAVADQPKQPLCFLPRGVDAERTLLISPNGQRHLLAVDPGAEDETPIPRSSPGAEAARLVVPNYVAWLHRIDRSGGDLSR